MAMLLISIVGIHAYTLLEIAKSLPPLSQRNAGYRSPSVEPDFLTTRSAFKIQQTSCVFNVVYIYFFLFRFLFFT